MKVALVTGGATGIGRAICEHLHREGFSVVVNYRSSQADAESLVSSLGKERAFAIQGDVSTQAGADAIVAGTVERFQGLSLLVNNAGWTKRTPHDDLDLLDEELIEKTLSTNLKGPIYMVKASMPHLKASNDALGHVINITSVAGIAANGSSSIYCASKAALSTMTRAWARAFAPSVRFNAVAPGFVNTGFFVAKDSEEGIAVAERSLQRVHIGRNVTPDDCAEAVMYLVRSAVTGEQLVVDGGKIALGSRG